MPAQELLIVAAFSRHPDALAGAKTRLEVEFGPVAFTSEPYAFHQTSYYEGVMGPNLQKLFFVFENLVAPDSLASAKRRTIEMEQELADSKRFPDPRPLNLDPGLLNLGKFMLATTKDQAHRIYLRDGIFAEVTLGFQDKEFYPNPWTYADYRQEVVLTFLKRARDFYRRRLGERKES